MSSCVTSVCNIWVSFFTDIAFPPFLLRMTRPSKVVDPSPPRPFAERRCSQHCFFSVQQVMPHLEWWIAIYKGRWNMIFAYLCRLETFWKTFVCRQMNHGSHMPFTNMQLSQRCSVAALFPVCLCLLIFCFHIPGMLGLFGKVPVTLSLESQIPSIVQQATWDKNQNRKIRWSLFGCRGCSCLDFQRIRIYFDQFWG